MGFRFDDVSIARDGANWPMAAAAEITLDLPVPPSVNKTRKIDHAGMGKLSAWRRSADKLVIYQRMRDRKNFGALPGAYELHITVSEQHSNIDLGNHEKVLGDYCVSLGLVQDDRKKFLRRIVMEWGEAPEGCRVSLRSLNT